jgi:hypothetical protein
MSAIRHWTREEAVAEATRALDFLSQEVTTNAERAEVALGPTIKRLEGAVSREHAVQAIGWLSAEVALHGPPSLGPDWLELWDIAVAATGCSKT